VARMRIDAGVAVGAGAEAGSESGVLEIVAGKGFCTRKTEP
jgi:hypothetical protein